jgi:uncharacterized protein involved in tolerance to divalent cations
MKETYWWIRLVEWEREVAVTVKTILVLMEMFFA